MGMERQPSRYPEADSIILLNRRAFLSSLALLAASCTTAGPEVVAKPPVIEPSVTSVPPTEVPKPPTATVEVRKPGEITASIAKFVEYAGLDEAIKKEILAGTKMPLPFSEKSLPVVVAQLLTKIKANHELYGALNGKDLIGNTLGFTFSSGTELVAFADGTVSLQPTATSPHALATTRFEFIADGQSSILYVYRVGGKVEVADGIQAFGVPGFMAKRVRAGEVIGRVVTPGTFPAFIYPPETIQNPAAIYNASIEQIRGRGYAESFKETGGQWIGSNLLTSSLLRNAAQEYIGIAAPRT